MAENIYLCHKCRNIFKLPMTCSIVPGEEEVKCPKCGGIDVEEMFSWTPIGFTETPPMWEYECQLCKHTFKLPIPSSPTQEEEIKCPKCGAGHIHRLTALVYEPFHCG